MTHEQVSHPCHRHLGPVGDVLWRVPDLAPSIETASVIACVA